MQRGEAKIEDWVGDQLKKWCREQGVMHVYLKFSVPGFIGWPDRLVLWEGGNHLFIEYKDPNSKHGLGPLQPYVHKLITTLGFTVEVHNDREAALQSIKRRILNSRNADRPTGL